jgi:hypothetical protein
MYQPGLYTGFQIAFLRWPAPIRTRPLVIRPAAWSPDRPTGHQTGLLVTRPAPGHQTGPWSPNRPHPLVTRLGYLVTGPVPGHQTRPWSQDRAPWSPDLLFRLRRTSTFANPGAPRRARPSQGSPCHKNKVLSRARETTLLSQQCCFSYAEHLLKKTATRRADPGRAKAHPPTKKCWWSVRAKQHIFHKHAVSPTQNNYIFLWQHTGPSQAEPSIGMPFHSQFRRPKKNVSRARETCFFYEFPFLSCGAP